MDSKLRCPALPCQWECWERHWERHWERQHPCWRVKHIKAKITANSHPVTSKKAPIPSLPPEKRPFSSEAVITRETAIMREIVITRETAIMREAAIAGKDAGAPSGAPSDQFPLTGISRRGILTA
ncbi:MAG: hypothetical protein NTX50_03720 [Candidatus Sumerlaeota bacterium]|nr:hypothetical protein [Candidatus Sumerlaeota bacterium]